MKLSLVRTELLAAARRCPRRAILAVAILSVLGGCYPVFFFGRSFVSANRVPMLSPGIPTLPATPKPKRKTSKARMPEPYVALRPQFIYSKPRPFPGWRAAALAPL